MTALSRIEEEYAEAERAAMANGATWTVAHLAGLRAVVEACAKDLRERVQELERECETYRERLKHSRGY